MTWPRDIPQTSMAAVGASQQVSVLFLGAGKRLSLLERFVIAGEVEALALTLLSMEGSPNVPIREVAEIIVGPAFESQKFAQTLRDEVVRRSISIVVPCMDSATVALAGIRQALRSVGCWAVVSDASLCEAMFDKLRAEQWFRDCQFPIPTRRVFPCLAKPRLGFGARGQYVAHCEEELNLFFRHHVRDDYIVQPLIAGQEYSVDGYVDVKGDVIGVLSRKRLEVSAGEVDVSETHRHQGILSLSRRLLSIPGWQGPINLQFFDTPDGPVLIEVNPRFGGGVTHAIHCGLDMPRWILREALGRAIEPFDEWPNGSLMTRCRRDIFYDYPR